MVLITGATGFVGKAFLEYLESVNYNKEDIILLASKDIVGYSTINHENYFFPKSKLEKYSIDCVIHLGAVTPKGYGKENVKLYLDNIRTTCHLVDSLPNIPQRFIYISSVDVYSRKGNPIINEEAEYTNDYIYGMTKILCEKFLTEWADEKHVDLQILRVGPVYGPGEETYAKIVGTFLRKALDNQDIVVYNGGRQIRNMIYVRDLCKCLYYSMICKEKIGTVNIVSCQSIEVKELAQIVIEEANSSSKIVDMESPVQIREDRFCSDKFWKTYGKFINQETSYREGVIQLKDYWSKLDEK